MNSQRGNPSLLLCESLPYRGGGLCVSQGSQGSPVLSQSEVALERRQARVGIYMYLFIFILIISSPVFSVFVLLPPSLVMSD